MTWHSDNEAVATVDEYGKVTGVSVGTATITVNCDGYSASCEVNVTARNITSGALTAEELAAIANYETEETVFWYTLTSSVYNRAGIYVEAFDTNIGFNTLRANVFSSTESDYTRMLMPGYYGGSKKVTGKTFVPADLKIGDIIATATAKCANGSWTYLTGIYQGEGKFLVSKRCCNQEGCSLVYEDIYGAELTDGKLANGMTSFWSTAAQLEAAYEYYFVLRPERLASDAIQSITLNGPGQPLNFSDANSLPAANAATLSYETVPAVAAAPVSVTWSTSNPDVATVDQNGNITAVGAGTCTITVKCDGYTATCNVTITRSIEARTTLTATEQAAITGYNTTEGDVWWYALGKAAYESAGITVDAFTPSADIDTFNDLQGKLLSGKTILDETELNKPYRTMLMHQHIGGASCNTGRTFVPGDFKVGDMLLTSYKTACSHSEEDGKNHWQYVVALYKGNDTFMVAHYSNGCAHEGCSKVYADVYGTELTNGHTSIWSDATTLNGSFKYYFVLRPEKLGHREITEGSLTQAETNAIAGYTTATPGTLAQFAENAYAQAGINLDPVTESASVSAACGALLVDSTGALIEGDTVWHKMLVEGSNGGSANAESTKTFTTAEFQVGDLFCAIGQCSEETKHWPAVTAVYLGNGRFLVNSFKDGCSSHGVYIDDIATMTSAGLIADETHVSIWSENAANLRAVWKHYFVLRPSQLAQ